MKNNQGVIPIEETKRIDWNAIRAEYIGGGISQRKLAKKYGVSDTTLMKKANAEGWHKLREKAESKSTAQAQQKTAEAAADNAVIAADMKKRLLLRLQRIEQKYPFDATEIRTQEGKNTVTFRLRDLTAAYKDLTADMATGTGNNELLQSLYDMERRAGL
jgi:transposase